METISKNTIEWLLSSEQPWVRYRTLVDVLNRPEEDKAVVESRRLMLNHPQVRELMAQASDWPGYALKRHNDAKLALHKLATLADFGLYHTDPGMAELIEKVMSRQSTNNGAFETLAIIPKAFGGSGEETWSWMLCDAPILLYALLSFGLGEETAVQHAVTHLISLIKESGWPCAASANLGKFQGPGRKDDPCPYANLVSLKALSLLPGHADDSAVRLGAEMLLTHWEVQKERKLRMFGIGTDFRKLKYPFIWYDILHVADTLSRYSFVHDDPRFREMVTTITAQRDDQGFYTAGSVWMACKEWDFGQKREPSPWITFLVARLLKRLET